MKCQIIGGALLIALPVLGFLAMLGNIATSAVNIMYVVVGSGFTLCSMVLGWILIQKKA